MSRQAPVHGLIRALSRRQRNDPRDEQVRLAAQARAHDACEYCLLPTVGRFELDHVIPPRLWADFLAGGLPVRPWRRVHRGPDHLDNLCWSCPFCNAAKGAAVGHAVGTTTYRLNNPRRDRWPEHFVFVRRYLFIVPLTEIGQATEATLNFNEGRHAGSLGARHDLIVEGRYPPDFARAWAVHV